MNIQEIKKYILKVQIFDISKIEERSGISQKTGKEWFIKTQEGYIDLGGQYPVMFKIPLKKEQLPYPVGNYYIHPSSFSTTSFFDLQVRDLVLVPAE